MPNHGTCFWCDHEFEECDVNGEGRERTEKKYAGHGNYSYHDHYRDRKDVVFLPGLYVCGACLGTAVLSANKLPKPDYRTPGIKAIDKLQASRKFTVPRLGQPIAKMTKSLQAYYRKVKAGNVNPFLAIEFRLDQKRSRGLLKEIAKSATIMWLPRCRRRHRPKENQ